MNRDPLDNTPQPPASQVARERKAEALERKIVQIVQQTDDGMADFNHAVLFAEVKGLFREYGRHDDDLHHELTEKVHYYSGRIIENLVSQGDPKGVETAAHVFHAWHDAYQDQPYAADKRMAMIERNAPLLFAASRLWEKDDLAGDVLATVLAAQEKMIVDACAVRQDLTLKSRQKNGAFFHAPLQESIERENACKKHVADFITEHAPDIIRAIPDMTADGLDPSRAATSERTNFNTMSHFVYSHVDQSYGLYGQAIDVLMRTGEKAHLCDFVYDLAPRLAAVYTEKYGEYEVVALGEDSPIRSERWRDTTHANKVMATSYDVLKKSDRPCEMLRFLDHCYLDVVDRYIACHETMAVCALYDATLEALKEDDDAQATFMNTYVTRSVYAMQAADRPDDAAKFMAHVHQASHLSKGAALLLLNENGESIVAASVACDDAAKDCATIVFGRNNADETAGRPCDAANARVYVSLHAQAGGYGDAGASETPARREKKMANFEKHAYDFSEKLCEGGIPSAHIPVSPRWVVVDSYRI